MGCSVTHVFFLPFFAALLILSKGAHNVCIIHSLDVSGEMLASGAGDKEAKVWHLPTRQCIAAFQHIGAPLLRFSLSSPLLSAVPNG